jgi:hypothetical protein
MDRLIGWFSALTSTAVAAAVSTLSVTAVSAFGGAVVNRYRPPSSITKVKGKELVRL